MRVIAIDGPAGSGKSTVARAVASKLGLQYLDTGAMYRAVAFAALKRGVDPADAEVVAQIALQVDLEIADRIIVDGSDATAEIRSPEVTRAVSVVAANPAVLTEMVARQREWVAAHGGGVVEGRDIGSVVFPDAELKVYLTADDAERASRRTREMGESHFKEVAADMARRDHVDSTRATSPLSVAPDAVVIDTTGVDIEEVVHDVLELAEVRQQRG